VPIIEPAWVSVDDSMRAANLDLGAHGHQEVARLDVAVDHAARVRVVEALQQVAHPGQYARQRGRAPGQHQRVERRALDELHHDIRRLGIFAVVVDGDDIRMGQAAGRLRLVLEAADQVGLLARAEHLLADRLERHDAFDPWIERLVDDAHCALAQDAVDPVFA
jgi:hypothetical protein